MWYRASFGGTWREYGVHMKHGTFCTIRAEQSGDVEAIAERNRRAAAEAEHVRLVRRVAGMSWSDVAALPTESLRQIVALLDAGKGDAK